MIGLFSPFSESIDKLHLFFNIQKAAILTIGSLLFGSSILKARLIQAIIFFPANIGRVRISLIERNNHLLRHLRVSRTFVARAYREKSKHTDQHYILHSLLLFYVF